MGVENDLSLLIISIIVADSVPNISTPHYDGFFHTWEVEGPLGCSDIKNM